MSNPTQIPYQFTKLSTDVALEKSEQFYNKMQQRRSIRYFSSESFPIEILQNIIKTAGTAPNGAHKQPWTFVVVQDPSIKKQIRIAAEKEEKRSYEERMSKEWLDDLAPLGTSWQKPFLENAPYLIVPFKQIYGLDNGHKVKHYYVAESMGIAVVMLISAIHNAGLATLTHTPSPMGFLRDILNRPDNERPFLVLPVGYPAEDCTVPNIHRKSLDEIMKIY